MRVHARDCPEPSSGLRDYIRDINDVSLLSHRQEHLLAERVAQGDPEARDRLIRANLRLVIHIARNYLGRGLPLEDLIAEGNLGLMRAVEGYDGRTGVRFSTYASFWIKQSIRRAVIMHGKPIRLPQYTVTLMAKWRRAVRGLAERSGREPTTEEVGQALRLSKRKLAVVQQALEINRLTSQLEGAAEDEDSLDELLADNRSKAAEDLVIEIDELERILAAIDRLEERAAMILRMRFGLDSYSPMTLSEVGKLLGLTRERARQIEKQAIARLVAELHDLVGQNPIHDGIRL